VAPVPFQPSLFDAAAPSFDRSFGTLRRISLDVECWIELASGWVSGSDALFEELLRTRRWGQRSRRMYDRRVQEPRLTPVERRRAPLEPAIVDEMRRALSRRYGVDLDSAASTCTATRGRGRLARRPNREAHRRAARRARVAR
jgi:hypothetical protein